MRLGDGHLPEFPDRDLPGLLRDPVPDRIGPITGCGISEEWDEVELDDLPILREQLEGQLKVMNEAIANAEKQNKSPKQRIGRPRSAPVPDAVHGAPGRAPCRLDLPAHPTQ